MILRGLSGRQINCNLYRKQGLNGLAGLSNGGPGDAQSGYTDIYGEYERRLVVVQWDQRGAGETYGRYGEQTPNLTIEQLVSDGIELALYLKKRFKRKDLIVLGHSLGTAIATGMVTKRERDHLDSGMLFSGRVLLPYQLEELLERERVVGEIWKFVSDDR